ncbi:26S protease regulatory subunit 7 [Fasciola hepatica]|uniref:26S protease regulatory subunit 7 n=1 Tax=Fasciola hepatica TaxID=6192 RepID=A0A4E0S336_FASHE|nr:26S protease regulatory subunit 7 [Fasciola hepatica]
MVLPADNEEGTRAVVGRTQRQINLPSPPKLSLRVTVTPADYKPAVKCGNVGGCEEQFEWSPEIIEKPCLHPKQFANLGTEPPKDMLLFGASGNGETILERAVVNRTETCLIRVICSELVRKYVDERAFLL